MWMQFVASKNITALHCIVLCCAYKSQLPSYTVDDTLMWALNQKQVNGREALIAAFVLCKSPEVSVRCSAQRFMRSSTAKRDGKCGRARHEGEGDMKQKVTG